MDSDLESARHRHSRGGGGGGDSLDNLDPVRHRGSPRLLLERFGVLAETRDSHTHGNPSFSGHRLTAIMICTLATSFRPRERERSYGLKPRLTCLGRLGLTGNLSTG